MNPRIAPAELKSADGRQRLMRRLLPEGMQPPNLFLTVARNAGLFELLIESGLLGPTGLLDREVIPSRVREIVILRTCVVHRCDYEFNLHVQTITNRMGVTDPEIDDLRRDRPDSRTWSPAEIAVIRLVDELATTRQVNDEVFRGARQHFEDSLLIEITFLVGLYTAVAMLVALAQPDYDFYRHPAPILSR